MLQGKSKASYHKNQINEHFCGEKLTHKKEKGKGKEGFVHEPHPTSTAFLQIGLRVRAASLSAAFTCWLEITIHIFKIKEVLM